MASFHTNLVSVYFKLIEIYLSGKWHWEFERGTQPGYFNPPPHFFLQFIQNRIIGIIGTGFLWAGYPSKNSIKGLNEILKLTVTSGPTSSFLHSSLNSWQKTNSSFYASSPMTAPVLAIFHLAKYYCVFQSV